KNGTHEWTISHYLDANCYTFGIAISGYIYGDYPNSNIAVRPCFYLESSVNLNGGNGTEVDPYRV
ncbi:MAG: hypothetical protein RSF02_03025, partial [Bacilli bacterium]